MLVRLLADCFIQTHVSIDDDRADDGSEEAHGVGDGVEDPQEGSGVVGRQVGDGQLHTKTNESRCTD